ncbi:MAG: insulinase family protein [Acidobacteriota bacterium]|nr:insulinase family protein [Acidobacteriota bacterium]
MKLPLLLLCTPLLLRAQDLKEFEKKVTEFTLLNGLHFIVCERHQAPVVSFHTYVNAGAVDDPSGKTGLAHMFEHMAFKGTEAIGSTNWVEEKKAMEAVERAYNKLEQERDKGPRTDKERAAKLEEDLKTEMDKANSFVEPNLYPRLIEENGGVGLNASTGEDSTNYFYNLPANRVELWFLLESGRFLRPVFREFYKERDVVREERRMRSESDPQGKLAELFTATAIEAHPYRRPPVGWASDIENLRLSDAEAFFNKYYVPGNITISIVGDVRPADIRRMADKYFAPIPKRPLPTPVVTVEPPQEGQKLAQVESASQPIELIGYKRPSQYDKDDPVFDVIASILSGGRTGLLYKDLVRDRKIALAAGADATYPGGKYPSLFLCYLVPSMGKSLDENEKAFYAILDRLRKDPIDTATLKRVKTKTRGSLIRQLDSNSGLANLLSNAYANYGDWRKLFTDLDEVDKVTAQDVQRVANLYFTDANRTAAWLVQPKPVQPKPVQPKVANSEGGAK